MAGSGDWPYLSVLDGPAAGARLVLDRPTDDILIGSDQNCRLVLPGVSPVHARLLVRDGAVVVHDAHSPRGLFVNQLRLSGQRTLRDGDVLTLGTPGHGDVTRIRCRLPPSALATPIPTVPTGTPIPPPPGAAATMLVPGLAVRPGEPPAAPPAQAAATTLVPPQQMPARPAPAPPPLAARHAPAPPPAPRRQPVTTPAPAPVARPAARPPAVAKPPRPASPAPARRGFPASVAMAAGLVVVAVLSFFGVRFIKGGSAASEAQPLAPAAAGAGQTAPPAPPEPRRPAGPIPVEEMVAIIEGATPPPPVEAPAAQAPPVTVAAPAPDPAVLRAQQVAAQVAPLLERARAATAAGRHDEAIALYDQALQLDPANAAATAGRGAAQQARATPRRSFVASQTVVRTEAAKGPAGFDTSDVRVQKAPDFMGRIEFDMDPASPQAGQPYTLRVYVVNQGEKVIKVLGVSYTTVVNGAKSEGRLPGKVQEIPLQERPLVEEIEGTWPEDVKTWSVDVTVTANRGDRLRSRLTLK